MLIAEWSSILFIFFLPAVIWIAELSAALDVCHLLQIAYRKLMILHVIDDRYRTKLLAPNIKIRQLDELLAD